MRLVIGVLALVSMATVSLALADPPATDSATAASAPASPSTAQPAAPTSAASPAPSPADQTRAPAAAAAGAKPAVDPHEERLISMGYRPQMHNGQKLFCKREPVMGSRVETTMRCGTVEQLTAETRMSREATENAERQQLPPPPGH